MSIQYFPGMLILPQGMTDDVAAEACDLMAPHKCWRVCAQCEMGESAHVENLQDGPGVWLKHKGQDERVCQWSIGSHEVEDATTPEVTYGLYTRQIMGILPLTFLSAIRADERYHAFEYVAHEDVDPMLDTPVKTEYAPCHAEVDTISVHDIHNGFVPLAVVLPDSTWIECPGITEWRAMPFEVKISQSADYKRPEQDPGWLRLVQDVMQQYSDHTAMLFNFSLPGGRDVNGSAV